MIYDIKKIIEKFGFALTDASGLPFVFPPYLFKIFVFVKQINR